MWPFARRNPGTSVVEVFAKPKNRTVFYEEAPEGQEGRAIKRGMCEAVMQAWDTGKTTLFTTQVKGRPESWTRIVVTAKQLPQAIKGKKKGNPWTNPHSVVTAHTADGTEVYNRKVRQGEEAAAFRDAMAEAVMKAWDEEASAKVTIHTYGLAPTTVTVTAETEPEGDNDADNPCC